MVEVLKKVRVLPAAPKSAHGVRVIKPVRVVTSRKKK